MKQKFGNVKNFNIDVGQFNPLNIGQQFQEDILINTSQKIVGKVECESWWYSQGPGYMV